MLELGFNIWHRFLDQYDDTIPGMNQTKFPKGFTINDKLFNTGYESEVVQYYKNRVIPLNNNYLYLTRPKIEMLSFAQRSDYHPFNIGVHVLSTKGKWWYGYENHDTNVAKDTIDNNGLNVKYSKLGKHNAGYVLSRLRPTSEQVNGDVPNNFFNDGQYSWYIKPRVKIPIGTPLGTKIFRVDIIKKDGSILDSIFINRNNFDYPDSSYSGNYKDEFNFGSTSNPLFLFDGADLKGTDPADGSQVDYRIFWYGNCDMWIQHVRVENDWAYRLFSDYYLRPSDAWIQWEVQNIAGNSQIKDKAYKFLADESEYNMYPAIGYLNHKIDSLKPQGSKISTIALNNIVFWIPFQRPHWMDTMQVSDVLQNFTNSGMNEIFTDIYPLYADVYSLPNFHQNQYIPNTLPVSGYNVSEGRLGLPYDPQQYEINFNQNIDNYEHHYIDFLNKANMISRERNVPHVAAIQIHSWYNGDETLYSLREPTNEEIEVLAGIAITYGAKGIIYHAYNSMDKTTSRGNQYTRGLIGDFTNPVTSECNGEKRIRNAYEQQKWDFIYILTSKLKNLGKTIIKFKNTETNSYRYHIPEERDAFKSSSCIDNIVTFRNFGANSNCTETNTPTNMIAECPNNTYLQVGTFKTTDDKERYLMIVNRRASPDSLSSINGRRYLRLRTKQNSSDFASFNNWKIIDVETNSEIAAFDKRQCNNIDIPLIRPGEIKLLKFVPVMKVGGTFVCDEEVISSTFVCDSTVFNNEHDLRLYQGTTIKFNTKGKIVFTGGSFYSGIQPQNSSPQSTEFIGNNCYWEGISFIGGTDIHISNSVFKNIAYEPQGGLNAQYQNCALSIINCNDITISSSQFYLDFKAGAIYYQYSSCENPWWENAYIGGNTFTISQSNINSPLVTSFSSLSAIETPIRLEGNYFNNISGTSAIATTLNGVCGGTIKNNNFNNFSDGVIATNSSIDLYNNRFYSDIAGAKSIQGFSESNLYMCPSDEYYLGGYNRINTMNDESKNVYVDNSFVFLENGDNTFDISEYSGIGEKPYHIFGTFPSINEQQYPAAYNCFRIDNADAEAFVDVTVNGTPIEFNFYPYSCNAMLSGNNEVVSIEGLVNDTIAVKHTGQGGSEKGNGGTGNETQVSRCKMLTDSINISIRKRQYSVTEQKCIELLNLFPDSTACFDALNKLYLSSLLQDSAGSKMAPLKAFYESAILNNPGKEKLINRCFYLIQKCKVSLKQYTSALEGFSLIIQQNPYTYEGLVASWDFAATHLLDSLGGSSGGYNGKTDEKKLTAFDITDRYDSTKFTKKQRTEISKSVNDILESKKINQTEKIEILQKKSKEGNREAAKELHAMKRLNETVKTKKPGNNSELQGIIQSDIKKVFSRADNNPTESVSIIPQSYQLYQNYPNPFNPTTKIAFDLPNDAKVKLIIYDILGREMKTLINNEYRSAGKYITEFNGSNMASGVYFARILVNEGKDFIAVKKLVLLK